MAKLKVKKESKEKHEEDKWPKQAALYMYHSDVEYQCKDCIFAKKDAKLCALFSTTEPINPEGGCNFFIHGDYKKVDIPIINLVTKVEAGYEESKVGFTCGRCEYFKADNSCEKVDRYSEGDTDGIIHVRGCCNRFEKDSKRGDMTPEQLDIFFKSKN